MPIWYQWLIPIVLIIAYLLNAIEIKKNINDSIIINSNLISWRDEGDENSCSLLKMKNRITKVQLGHNYIFN
jgi:hypothetical protein